VTGGERSGEAALYRENHPERFWRLLGTPAGDQQWAAAVAAAAGSLPGPARPSDSAEAILHATLGEGQFGPDHWELGAAKRLYYRLKPLLPRAVTRVTRRAYGRGTTAGFPLSWPVEGRYAEFLAQVVRRLLELSARDEFEFIHFWPEGHRFALVLTHDIETAKGQDHVLQVADLEARLGFRSSFNFVPQRYPVDRGLIRELRDRGFEVGLHDLHHDGRLFASRAQFARQAAAINEHIDDLGTVGFRAALTHRNPLWMQDLNVGYDLSFFDTDPYEPIAGGTMSLWPFWIGRFLELPYTLVQDYTLVRVLGERSPQIWLEKVDFIASRCGLALVNSHPDYLREAVCRRVYEEFLESMAARSDLWHCLAVEAFDWWRARHAAASLADLPGGVGARVGVDGWDSITVGRPVRPGAAAETVKVVR
jgi:hypothetical protein